MKRTKPRGPGGSKNQDDVTDFWAKPAAPEKTWAEATEGQADDAFAAYSMATRYAKDQLLAHPKFGKGVVTDVEASRVEILFQDGKRKLGHGVTG